MLRCSANGVAPARSCADAAAAELRPQLLGLRGHERRDPDRHRHQLLHQRAEHRLEGFALGGILRQRPRLPLLHEGVGAEDDHPERAERLVQQVAATAVHGGVVGRQVARVRRQHGRVARAGHHAIAVLLDHRDRAAGEVAERVARSAV
jgi:hypothetical protein